MLDNETLDILEFGKIKQLLLKYCHSEGAKSKANTISPSNSIEAILPQLYQTNELTQLLRVNSFFPAVEFDDFRKEVQLIGIEGGLLNETQFINLKKAVEISNTLIRFLKGKKTLLPYLSKLVDAVEENKFIVEEIDRIIDVDGTVKSSASKDLLKIRKDISEKTRESNRKFDAYVNELRKLDYLRDNEESFFNGRRTLAVLADYKQNVPGLIHSKSESGKTIFVEPHITIEINNELAELEIDERREINKLLRELSSAIHPYTYQLRAYYDLLVDIDFIQAKSKLAVSLNATLPTITNEQNLNLQQAFHPLLFLQNKLLNKKIIPLTVRLYNEQRLLVISGPNAGGKSITLKTIGLLQLMLQSGLLVPVKETSDMCFFKHILVDIGDTQSIEHELSTYSARLKNMQHILEKADSESLVLMDEFGGGTDPELGGAMAEVTLEELAQSKALGIITTHYSNIKVLAEKLTGVVNGSMLFDIETLEPRYTLSVGSPGSSYTFEVAERVGFPKDLIHRAKQKIDREKVNLSKLLAEVQQQKTKLDEALERTAHEEFMKRIAKEKYNTLFQTWTDKLENERERKIELARLAGYGQRYLRLMNDWNDKQEKKQVIKRFIDGITAETKKKQELAKNNKREDYIEKKIARIKPQLKIGAKVRILNSSEIGVIETIKNEKVGVAFGAVKLTVSLENLEIVKD